MGIFSPIDDIIVVVNYYPGANLAQAYHIIKHRTPMSANTQHVVLAFGINNRDQGNLTIIKKALEHWWKMNYYKGLLRSTSGDPEDVKQLH